MYLNVRKDTFWVAQILSIINERICSEVDAVHDSVGPPAAESPRQQAVDWANSLGYGPIQGAVGKGGAGSGKGWNSEKGKGFGKDWNKGSEKGKEQGAGKGERPIGACSQASDTTTALAPSGWARKLLHRRRRILQPRAAAKIGPRARRKKTRAKASVARKECTASTVGTARGRETR